jgi:hypothetical protein
MVALFNFRASRPLSKIQGVPGRYSKCHDHSPLLQIALSIIPLYLHPHARVTNL